MKPLPTVEERVWAVLAHLSALTFGMGVVLPIIGWAEQRQKSKYASFQSLQALGYQSLGFTLWLLVLLVLGVLLILIVLVGVESEANPDVFRPVLYGALLLVALTIILYMALPIIAAIQCGLGRDANYPILGSRLRRYLGYSAPLDEASMIEENEDRWVTAMCHFSVINLFWGILAPAAAWFMQGKRSSFLRFQLVQAVVFQAAAFLLLVLAMLLVLGGTLLFALSMGIMIPGAEFLIAPQLLLGGIIYVVTQFCASVFFLAVPLFHIMGQWAGFRVLKGDDYRYPVLGNLVEKALNREAR